jgi:Spy/CpxP family protein refolding chaperone
MKLRHALVLFVFLASCSKRAEPPLPGDTVTASGSVALTAPKFSTMPEPAPPLGAIESKLFSPDLVMEHQAAIDLKPAQRESILKEIDHGQSELTRLQWDLQAEKEKLVAILDSDKVDEAKTNDQATRVMERENKIKSVHLSMLVRIKNLLGPEQQKKLRELRDADRASPKERDR